MDRPAHGDIDEPGPLSRDWRTLVSDCALGRVDPDDMGLVLCETAALGRTPWELAAAVTGYSERLELAVELNAKREALQTELNRLDVVIQRLTTV